MQPGSDQRNFAKRADRTVPRKKWRCPNCRHRFHIPVDNDPELCSECLQHRSAVPAMPAKSRIPVEPADPLVEFLSGLTGRRFSHRSLVLSAIVVGLAFALLVLLTMRKGPVPRGEPSPVAEAERRTPDVFGLLTTPRRTIPQSVAVTPPERDRTAAKTPVLGNVVRGHRAPSPHDPLQPTSILDWSRGPAVAVGSGNAHQQGEQTSQDSDLLAVHTWLKERLDGRNYQLVKWWPSKPVDGDLVTYAGLLKSDRVARLKYRVTDEKDSRVRDDVFVFRENKVRAVPGGENWWWNEWGGWTGLIIQGTRRLLPDRDEQVPSIASTTKLPATSAPGQRAQPASDLVGKDRERAGKKDPSLRVRKSAKGKRPREAWWAKYADEADLDLVRTWLKDNRPDWDEIRSWKPLDFIEYGWSTNPQRSAVVLLDDKTKRSRLGGVGGLRPDRVQREHVCRIRIRIKDDAQGPKVEDRLFRIDQGKVEPILDPGRKRHEWKYFPDSQGTKPVSPE